MDLRKIAEGQECQVRLPYVCNYLPETTVLAHYRLAGYCGTGIKPDDFVFGAWACSDCHDVIDGRVRLSHFSKEQLKLYHVEAILRTQFEIAKQGFLS